MDVVVGEYLHKSVANLCTGHRLPDLERVETAACSDSEASKLHQQVLVMFSRA